MLSKSDQLSFWNINNKRKASIRVLSRFEHSAGRCCTYRRAIVCSALPVSPYFVHWSFELLPSRPWSRHWSERASDRRSCSKHVPHKEQSTRHAENPRLRCQGNSTVDLSEGWGGFGFVKDLNTSDCGNVPIWLLNFPKSSTGIENESMIWDESIWQRKTALSNN